MKTFLKGLTETEKKMVNHFHRVEIRGKFNRKVPILLTNNISSVRKVLRLRQTVPHLTTGEAEDPQHYLFTTPTGEKTHRGSDALRVCPQSQGSESIVLHLHESSQTACNSLASHGNQQTGSTPAGRFSQP